MQSVAEGRAELFPGPGLTRGTTLILAATAGLSVANIYYAQPLLDVMGRDLSISSDRVGLVVTLTQVGYGLGLILIVPLGDRMDRRRLVIAQVALSVLALLTVAASGTAAMLFAGMAALGLLAVVVQVLVAFAATLAVPNAQGKAIGTVTGGIVAGILAARFMAGMIADLGGWRAVYGLSAGATLVMLGVLAHSLPSHPAPPQGGRYAEALRSIPLLFVRDPVLLVRGVLAALIFASFGTLWTTLVFPLRADPFAYSHGQIGLFGLVGLAGALAATGAGRLADRGLGQWTTGGALVILTASWGAIALLPRSIPLLVVGILLLDLAVQAVHVTNQSIILARHPEARSRLVGGYMVFYSVGSAIGAGSATMIYAQAGWLGVSALGAAFSALALGVWAGTLRLDRSG